MATNQQTAKYPASKESLLYRFLVSPAYRVARHAMLILAIAVITLSINTHSFLRNANDIGNLIYPITLITLTVYLIIGYLHIYVLVPRFLMRKKYLEYILFSSATVCILVLQRPLLEYWVNSYLGLPHIRTSYANFVSLLDALSDFMLNMLCITGAAVTVLLQHWMTESKRVNELEKNHLQQEVNMMKEQINPDLLFNTLNRTGNLAEANPDKAASMVLQLSRLLRYQLYDGSRERVLLNSEIDFLKNYLTLEQFYSDNFDHTITVTGDTSRVLVPPLLFIPFVQAAVKGVKREEVRSGISILFDASREYLSFTCRFIGNRDFSGSEFFEPTARLEHLYRNSYTFSVKEDAATKETMFNLRLKSGSYE